MFIFFFFFFQAEDGIRDLYVTGVQTCALPISSSDPRLARVADAVAETGIETALAVPLVVHDEVIGLLAIYPDRTRPPTADDATLMTALSAQLGVAVQNARLHERAKQLGGELEQALSSERQA